MNPMAEKLTGWVLEKATGQPLIEVFNIINAQTLKPVETPVEKVIETGLIVGLANHTVLIAKDGTEYQISDSGAPICSPAGDITGVVLVFRDVTTEYGLHEELKASKALVDNLMQTLPDMIWLKDVKGTYLMCNARFEELYGATAKEIVGKTDYDFADKELADFFREKDKAALKAGKATTNEELVTFAHDGHTELVETIKSPLTDDEGKLIGILGIARDITDRKQSEEKLRESELRLDEAQRYAKIGNWELLADEKTAFWSEQMYVLFGLSSDVKAGPETLCDVMRNSDIPLFTTSVRESLSTGHEHHVEYQITRPSDGEKRWIECRGKVLTNDDGEYEKISGFIQDITERKEAELILQQSEERYGAIFEGSMTEIFIFDAETYHFIKVNEGARENIGYSDEELSQLTPLDIKPEMSLEQFNALVEPLRSGEEKIVHFETIHQRKNGTRYNVDVYVQLSDFMGKPAFLAIILDITERKEAELILQQSEERYGAIFEGSMTEIFIFDAETYHFIKVNEAARENIGYSDEELSLMTAIDLQPEISLGDFNTFIKPLRSSGKKKAHFETLLQRKNGTCYNVDVYVQLSDFKGKLVLLGVVLDITERKKAEEQLLLSSRIFTDTYEGITITDADHCIVDVNPAFSMITGYSREEVMGKNPRILSSGKQGGEFYADMWRQLNEGGHWQGEIWNRKKTGEVYAELLTISSLTNGDGDVTNYVGVFTDITSSKQQQEQLKLMAHYDVLTGLPNRALFIDRFNQAIAHSKRTEQELAVCFLDLDNFKPVNDQYGHERGDELLVEVARRIQACIREEDTISRQGGDEFALLLNDIGSFEQVEQTLTRIHHAVSKPYVTEGASHHLTISSGVTLYPSDEGDIDTLLRHADQAMYQAKQMGRDRYHVFNAEQDRQISQKNRRLAEIEQALANNEFELYYQPKVNMVSGDVFGVEALIRWIHPDNGIIPPLDFLPIIEGTELEIQIGEWVINAALAQLDRWQRQGIQLEVSVNIASDHLLTENFAVSLESALAKFPAIEPHYLQLEILESSALGDLKSINKTLSSCHKNLGVMSALDDFGTGYSSLTHLRNLPVDAIKIDQSFVRDMLDDPSDYTIIDGTIGLANAFNRELIAEGVETTEHGLMLLLMGCQQAQGYGIARPMPADDFPTWLKGYVPNQQWLILGNKQQTEKETKESLFKLITKRWHANFTACLESSPQTIEHWPIMDTKLCPCGSWLQRAKQDKLHPKEDLNQLDQAHNALHAVADALLLQYEEGDVEGARHDLAKLNSAVEEMGRVLERCV